MMKSPAFLSGKRSDVLLSVHMNPVIVSLSHRRVALADFGSVAATRIEGTMDGLCITVL